MARYNFRDLTTTTVEDDPEQITEGIVFGNFDSIKEDLYLIERDAPTPDEKGVTSSLPLTQGAYDFSMAGGVRFFSERTLTYQLAYFGRKYAGDYNSRKYAETHWKQMIMPQGQAALEDSHDTGWHWLAKCKSVAVSQDEEHNILTLTLTFTGYPFLIRDIGAGGDQRWDDLNADYDVGQYTDFTVDGTTTAKLINSSDTPITPTISITGAVVVSNSGSTPVGGDEGTYTSSWLTLQTGLNFLTLTGNGTVHFDWFAEVMA